MALKKIKYRVTDATTAIAAGRAIASMPINHPMVVTVEKETRSIADNAVQWPILNAFADQLLWPVNGAMGKISAEEWKQILTAAYKEETVRLAMGLNGGVVMLGYRTREFKHAEWSDWMAFLESVAADRGVKIPMSKAQAVKYAY